MIAEIFTGLFAGLTTGYLYSRHKHQKLQEEMQEKIDKVTLSSEAGNYNNNKDYLDDKYWWNKFEHRNKLAKTMPKFPERASEMNEKLKKEKEKMKEEEGEVPLTLSPVTKKQYK
jgi:hypothetical protein